MAGSPLKRRRGRPAKHLPGQPRHSRPVDESIPIRKSARLQLSSGEDTQSVPPSPSSTPSVLTEDTDAEDLGSVNTRVDVATALLDLGKDGKAAGELERDDTLPSMVFPIQNLDFPDDSDEEKLSVHDFEEKEDSETSEQQKESVSDVDSEIGMSRQINSRHRT